MKSLFIILLLLPLKIVNNDKIAVIISKMGTFSQSIETYQKTGLKRGENKQAKKKRINLLKRKLFVLEYNMIGRNININDMR